MSHIPRQALALLLVLGALHALGCAELTEEAAAPAAQQSRRAQRVTLVPEFTISGIDAIPEELYLTELSFVVSEIRLEPLTGPNRGVAYSVVTPQLVTFDVSRGQSVRFGQPIELPEPGRYLVSLRLEPVELSKAATGGATTPERPFSFVMTGFIAQQRTADAEKAAQVADGEGERPIPHPFDGKDEEPVNEEVGAYAEAPESWTLFHYHSERAAFIPMNDVELSGGEQHLAFHFDMRAWSGNLIEPISKAVSTTTTGPVLDERGIDVSRQLDSLGRGVESLMELGRVRADRVR